MQTRSHAEVFMAAAAASIILISALTGCSATEGKPTKTHSAAAEVQTAPEPTPTPSRPPSPNYYVFNLICNSIDYKTKTTFRSFEDAWAGTGPGKFAGCKAELFWGTQPSPVDTAAITAAGYQPGNIGLIYGMCMDLGGYYYTNPTISSAQAGDVAGMAVLCPNNPQMPAVLAKAAAAGAIVQAIADGSQIEPGLYQVGAQITSGTFVHDGAVANCYWERLDANGNIIANNFILSANRVQVTIAPGDFSFNSTSCGSWLRAR